MAALALSGLGAPVPAAEGPLASVDVLARAGAPQLALRMMENAPGAPRPGEPGFARWERAHIDLLARAERWEAVVERARSIRPRVEPALALWLREQELAALGRLGRHEEMLRQAREWFWAQDGVIAPEKWREWIVRAFLGAGRTDDAYTAMLRLRQDFPGRHAGRDELAAEVMLAAGRSAQAASLLEGLEGQSAALVRLRASLAAGSRPADEILEKAQAAAEDPELAVQRRLGYWRLAARAAQEAGAATREIRALEEALALLGKHDWLGSPGGAADRLWAAYRALGKRLGNAEGLLVGQDRAWFAAALNREESAPVEARALYASLAAGSSRERTVAMAHEALARLLTRTGGTALLAAAYAESGVFPTVESVPEPVRYQLVDHALAQRDIGQAAALMETLEKPPADEQEHALAWQLRRARVQILAGHFEAGAGILRTLVADGKAREPETLDRLLQVCFDLQKAEAHELVLEQFRALLAGPLDARHRREILFWTAESLAATGDTTGAAAHFLQSATLPGAYTLDPWARTALYHAATNLRAAGLRADARRILQRLLEVAEDPARRAMLQRDMQQLWLGAGGE